MYRIILVLVLVLLGTSTAVAHHGWSSYDASRELTLTGTIKAHETYHDNRLGVDVQQTVLTRCKAVQHPAADVA